VGVVEEIESTLLAAAKESDKFVREAALEALALCDTEASVDALTEALSDELPQIRDLAERLLIERIARPTGLAPPALRPKQLAAFIAAASQGYGSEPADSGERTP
jgi:HEAT repeat protein